MATEKRFISLDEALDATHREVFWTESEAAAVRSFLVKQPKVDTAEVVRGHWQYGTQGAVCSVCEFARHLDDNFGSAIACPNCSAFMDVRSTAGQEE